MNAMNRREFLGSGIAAGLYSAGSERMFPFAQLNGIHPDDGIAGATPDWLLNEPVVMAGCWDDFPLFQRRLGGGPDWYEDLYREQRSERTVEQLKEIGITFAIIHFFKGFGLEAEREHIADAVELSKRLKQNGIRVGLYVGSTICYETFLLETPEAEEWFVPDYMGKPVYYDHQTFRKRVYCMHPGYRDYIKRVVRIGIEHLHADCIHFDNTSKQAAPEIFQHPLAIQDFRKYLSSKYAPSELKERLGFSDPRYVIAPQLDGSLHTLDDPLFQEWTDFRCHQLSAYYAEMSSFIRSINPSVAVDNNPSSGMAGRNTIWEQGVDYSRLLRTVDVAWTEEGDNAGVAPNGVLVSKIRSYKVASIMQKRIFCSTYGAVGGWGHEHHGGGLLQMAESMAYNSQGIGMVGGFHDLQHLPAKPQEYIRFFHDNFQIYRSPKSVADVALLYSFSTMAFNNEGPQVSFMLASQMLIQNRLLFDIVFDQHLENLSKYRVLFLADQQCLSDRQIELVHEFVMQGGGLIATEQTSLYTDRRKRRRDFGLKECFEILAPRWNGPAAHEASRSGNPVRRSIGKGRAVYVPEILPAVNKPLHDAMRSQYWVPALNQESLHEEVLWALGGNPTVKALDPVSPYVTFELVHQETENRLILHVLNYDHARTPLIQNVHVEATIPTGKKVEHLEMLTPDKDEKSFHLNWSGVQTVRFTLPSLQIYSLVVFHLDNI
ncbi:MAG: alpha-amylase family protein [Sulfobacillus sp.]